MWVLQKSNVNLYGKWFKILRVWLLEMFFCPFSVSMCCAGIEGLHMPDLCSPISYCSWSPQENYKTLFWDPAEERTDLFQLILRWIFRCFFLPSFTLDSQNKTHKGLPYLKSYLQQEADFHCMTLCDHSTKGWFEGSDSNACTCYFRCPHSTWEASASVDPIAVNPLARHNYQRTQQ